MFDRTWIWERITTTQMTWVKQIRRLSIYGWRHRTWRPHNSQNRSRSLVGSIFLKLKSDNQKHLKCIALFGPWSNVWIGPKLNPKIPSLHEFGSFLINFNMKDDHFRILHGMTSRGGWCHQRSAPGSSWRCHVRGTWWFLMAMVSCRCMGMGQRWLMIRFSYGFSMFFFQRFSFYVFFFLWFSINGWRSY